MKTNIKLFRLMAALAIGFVSMTAIQCGKAEGTDPQNYNARHSKCLQHTDKEAKGYYSPDSASVVYDAASQRLHVTHHNLMVNCGTAEIEGGIIVSVTRNGQTIDIYESEDENNPLARCMCDVDNEFDLDGIEQGTYTLVFHKSYPAPLSVTFTF